MMCFWASTYGSGYPDPHQNDTDPDAENYFLLADSYFSFRFEETKEPFRCCGEASCLASGDKVKKLLDPDVLTVQICHRYATGEDKNQLKPENFRYIAYRNVFFLLNGRTRAKMSRAPLPSCIIMKIREAFPDPNNQYTGFRAKNQLI